VNRNVNGKGELQMVSRYQGLLLAGLLLAGGAVGGCYHDKPHEYGRERPPVDELDDRDSGLQSKDVVSASDQMAKDLLTSVPELHTSNERWTIVVDRAENLTTDSRQNLDIFLQRLRVRLNELGRGRIALIENRDRLRDMQSRELEPTASLDEFGQGAGGGGYTPGGAGQQPNFSLYAKISEMRNRGTSYYFMEFTLTAIQGTPQYRAREIVWTKGYEVKVNN
jgi:hypothetical protein